MEWPWTKHSNAIIALLFIEKIIQSTQPDCMLQNYCNTKI